MRKRRLLEGRWLVDARTDGSTVGPPGRILGRQLQEDRKLWGSPGGSGLAGDTVGASCPQQVELELNLLLQSRVTARRPLLS